MIEFGDAAELPVSSRTKIKLNEHFSALPTPKLNRQKIQFYLTRFFHPSALITGFVSRRAAHV
jgi:hypothetical protein